MFNQLFSRSDALTRQLSVPLVEERRQYLTECASQGMSRTTLRAKSLLLLSMTEPIKYSDELDSDLSDLIQSVKKLRLEGRLQNAGTAAISRDCDSGMVEKGDGGRCGVDNPMLQSTWE